MRWAPGRSCAPAPQARILASKISPPPAGSDLEPAAVTECGRPKAPCGQACQERGTRWAVRDMRQIGRGGQCKVPVRTRSVRVRSSDVQWVCPIGPALRPDPLQLAGGVCPGAAE